MKKKKKKKNTDGREQEARPEGRRIRERPRKTYIYDIDEIARKT
jgi:hypothetical protein